MKGINKHRTLKLSLLVEASGGLVRFAGAGRDIFVSAVEYDSRKVGKGGLFVAVEGYETDGHLFVEKAVAAGASAVVVSSARVRDFAGLEERGVVLLSSDNTRKSLSLAAALYFDYPSRDMLVIGITGTNGKTSTAYMLESILNGAGMQAGVIGTINYRWGGKSVTAPNTTPESRDLCELMADMRDEGVRALIMEVSSHALELNRADDVQFDIAVFTNLTRDHMDFHKNFEDYFRAKERIFKILDRSIKPGRAGILNMDDEYAQRIFGTRNRYSYPFVTFGMGVGCHYHPAGKSIVNSLTGLEYDLETPQSCVRVALSLSGRFHIYNSMAAVAAARAAGISLDKITAGLGGLKRVPGRFDVITSAMGFSVVVDYAHTDDALLKLLQSVKELEHRRIITVFGCGGDRDRTKRPLMGRVASENSDYTIVTSDNPRTEDRDAIISEIVSGLDRESLEVIPDRSEAIGRAVSMAGQGDIIVIAGKGHEDYQIIGREKIHFDDGETASRHIRGRMAG